MKKNYILLFFALVLSGQMMGQYRWEAGAVVGLANYQGDLVEGYLPIFKESNIGFGVGARYLLNYNWALRGNLLFSKLTGDDFNSEIERRRRRGMTFENSFTEMSIRLEWEPFGESHYLSIQENSSMFSPFFTIGAGLAFTNPQIDYSRTKSNYVLMKIEEDENAAYFKTRFIVIFGLGVKYNINDYWIIGLEGGMRYAFTDYLDGVSKAGISKNRDWYNFVGISLFHRLPGTERTGGE